MRPQAVDRDGIKYLNRLRLTIVGSRKKMGNILTGHEKLRYLRLYGTGIRLIAFKLMMLIYLVFNMIIHKSAGKYDLP